jgi:hypothetical protein
MALTAVTSCFMLTTGVALAAPVPIADCGPNKTLTAGGPSDPNPSGFTFTGVTGPTTLNPGGTCELTNSFDKQVTIDVDFEDNITNDSGIFTYSILSSIGPFQEVRIDSDTDGIGGTTSVLKEIFSDELLTNRIGFEESIDGSQELISLTNKNLSKIYIRDTYSASGTTRLDNMTNSFLVPGPLPILGAGAAFGFSRKLRVRIKAPRIA